MVVVVVVVAGATIVTITSFDRTGVPLLLHAAVRVTVPAFISGPIIRGLLVNDWPAPLLAPSVHDAPARFVDHVSVTESPTLTETEAELLTARFTYGADTATAFRLAVWDSDTPPPAHVTVIEACPTGRAIWREPFALDSGPLLPLVVDDNVHDAPLMFVTHESVNALFAETFIVVCGFVALVGLSTMVILRYGAGAVDVVD